ncbi:hypothetical protein HPB48_020347 [Haemaphysalis longicornis]|uniref:MULE transposase domain-containing protein n=1 Tax=Haemaphysalis longicornis TaxID=44386 RepID=A0A9J6GPE1_HAELO|nr:hypothetical protein HPB48_020347 [Haemaphysalis longicornis]
MSDADPLEGCVDDADASTSDAPVIRCAFSGRGVCGAVGSTTWRQHKHVLDSTESPNEMHKAPAAFMTDNSSAEKKALSEVWPSAQQLLCHFHVLQAEWRWLMSAAKNVEKDMRRQLMAAFKKVKQARQLKSTTS